MKLNALKLLSIACLLSIGNLSYAADTSTTQKNADRVSVKKIKSDTTDHEGDGTRSVGDALAKKYKVSEANPDKQRIKELEDLASKQQKLIEMYKKQSNP